MKIYGDDLDGYISEFKTLPLVARKKFLERIMKETILFSYKGSGYRKLDTDLACERMDFVRLFLYNLSQSYNDRYVDVSYELVNDGGNDEECRNISVR